MSEQAIQNEIRNDAAGKVLMFRANVGQAWVGIPTRLPNGDLLLKQPRPFNSGLPPGFSDLFFCKPLVITPEMVGQTIGQFGAVEVKDAKGRVSEPQEKFIAAVKRNGGLAGVARSVEEARKIYGTR
jgi:hypothetical protein